MVVTRFLYACMLIVLINANTSYSQSILPSTPAEMEASVNQTKKLRSVSVLKHYPVRSTGPVVMSGRVTDIAVHPENPRIFYIGFASGGVFKTTNSGNTMEPVFDYEGTLGIGDLAISRSNPEVIWVGTGENNSSRSSYAGAGVYKSNNGGKSWAYAGLRGTQHIGRIVIHPTNENTVWVASQGALYSKNEDRGIFKTTDGGLTWRKTLFVDDSTGIIDLAIHPTNPEILWAASWERDRKAWDFKEGGIGSSIYKSTDGGDTWHKSANGLPQGSFTGRIGIDVSRNNPDILYAVVDNQFETKKEKKQDLSELTSVAFTNMSKNEFLKLDNKQLDGYLKRNNFPEKYDAVKVKKEIQAGKYTPKALADYLGDANQALFETDVTGMEVYRSDNGGKNWNKVNSTPLKGVFNTYGYYFGEIRIDPNNPDVVYTLGVPLIKSTNGGKTWAIKADKQPVHADHHALWIDPDDSEHILLGNDGGLYESHDGGENFIHHNVAAAGQFYSVNIDFEEPYNIYGGLQDNGTYYAPSTSTANDGNYWKPIYGGDGMHVAVNPNNSNIIYYGYQYGNYFRTDKEKNETYSITPKNDIGEPANRFNWNAPLNISHHNPDIVYIGSQRLYRSFDQGKTWAAISPDLTHNLPNGDVPYSTLTTIGESPVNFNVIWAGTDDGNVQLTTNGGSTWQNVTTGLPEKRWISEVHPSKYDEATAYVSLNGYRYDEFKTYIFKTTDYGKTWTSLKGNLPDQAVNVIVQDPEIPNILYAGLDNGTYVSFDDGSEWQYLSQLPNVATYDMVVHPRDLELVIGTHGRSIYVIDVKPLHFISDKLDKPITALQPQEIRFSEYWGHKFAEYREVYMPEVKLMYFLGNPGENQNVALSIKNEKGKIIKTFSATGDHGFNTYSWNLVVDENAEGIEKFIQKGTYKIEFKTGKNTDEVDFNIK